MGYIPVSFLVQDLMPSYMRVSLASDSIPPCLCVTCSEPVSQTLSIPLLCDCTLHALHLSYTRHVELAW